MPTLPERILNYLRENPLKGASDAEIRTTLHVRHIAHVNQTCRRLTRKGLIVRDGQSGQIKNFIQPKPGQAEVRSPAAKLPPPPFPDKTSGSTPLQSATSITSLGHTFHFICNITPKAIDSPHARYNNTKNLPLSRWYGRGEFCHFRIPPKGFGAGVYIISADSTLAYVGRTSDLARRFNVEYGQISPRKCFEGGQETNCRINQKILDAVKEGQLVKLWFLTTEDHERIEGVLLAEKRSDPSKWPWNHKH